LSRVERIGDATLYLGDAMTVLGELEAGIELVVTDPPYSSGARRDAERQVRGAMLRSMEDEDWFSHDAMTGWGFSWFIRGAFTSLRSQLIAGAHVYVFIDWRQTPNVYGMGSRSRPLHGQRHDRSRLRPSRPQVHRHRD
jgi:site-specific DNA-methyltransferase (adenine-specific)